MSLYYAAMVDNVDVNDMALLRKSHGQCCEIIAQLRPLSQAVQLSNSLSLAFSLFLLENTLQTVLHPHSILRSKCFHNSSTSPHSQND